jgi:alanyl-tRNA synthetase
VGNAHPTKTGVTSNSTGKVEAGELVNFVAQQVGGSEPAKLDAALASVTDGVAAKL